MSNLAASPACRITVEAAPKNGLVSFEIILEPIKITTGEIRSSKTVCLKTLEDLLRITLESPSAAGLTLNSCSVVHPQVN